MQERQAAELAAFKRMLKLIDDREPEFGSVAKMPARKRLQKWTEAIDDAFAGQVKTQQMQESLTARKHLLREALRNTQGTIAALAQAKSMAPELAHLSTYRMPHIRTDDMTLLDTARGMLKAASKNANVFDRHAGERDFLVRFAREIDALEACIIQRGHARIEHARHAGVVTHLLKKARADRNILTRFLVAELKGKQALLLQSWRAAMRVQRKPGVKRSRSDQARGP